MESFGPSLPYPSWNNDLALGNVSHTEKEGESKLFGDTFFSCAAFYYLLTVCTQISLKKWIFCISSTWRPLPGRGAQPSCVGVTPFATAPKEATVLSGG